MLLRIELEAFSTTIESGTIARWYVEEGGRARFGEPLCDIDVDEVFRLRRRQGSAELVAERFPSAHKEAHRAAIKVRLTSADDGTVISIRKAVGSKVQIGDLLAIAATGDSHAADPDGPAIDDAPRFRVVGDTLDVDDVGRQV
jgi:pyruvate/2-oxoglutarate dehydrogenase complex dihydrolipoamide acyltransferase (E2) component